MTDGKPRGRREIVIFASLATALIVGVVLLLVLPGRKTPPTTSAPASASSSAPKVAAPAWTPPNFEDEDSLPPLPTHEAPEVVATGSAPVVSPKVLTHFKDEPEDEFPLTPAKIQDTVDRFSPRLKQQCATDKPTKVTLLLELEPDGWVKSTKVQSFDGDESVAKCVSEKVQRWHFASTSGGGTASIPLVVGK